MESRTRTKASKKEAMLIPKLGKTSKPKETANIKLDNNKYFSFCTNFKYLKKHIHQ
jgi:hypothetical protein